MTGVAKRKLVTSKSTHSFSRPFGSVSGSNQYNTWDERPKPIVRTAWSIYDMKA